MMRHTLRQSPELLRAWAKAQVPSTAVVALGRTRRDGTGLQKGQTVTTTGPLHVGMVMEQRRGLPQNRAQTLELRLLQ